VYSVEAEKCMYNHSGLEFPQSDIWIIFLNAYETVASMKKAKKHFKLEDYIHLTQMCLLIRIFFYQKSVMSPRKLA
jgi:hypothetical protein